MKVTDKPVIVEETFDASVNEVWDAITRADRMREWFFDNIPNFKPEVGFETRFSVRSGDRVFPHRWHVQEVVPQQILRYGWKYDGYAGDASVVFVLSKAGPGTKLELILTVLEDFPDDIPEFKRESCVAGWEYFIGERLKAYLKSP